VIADPPADGAVQESETCVSPAVAAKLVGVPGTAVVCEPVLIKVDVEFWLLYSVVIKSAERATVEMRTSSTRPR